MEQPKAPGGPVVTEPAGGSDTMPLLPTKLYRPSLGPDIEQRTGLLEHLNRCRHRPLTLISAPAGYGKTTLASMWLQASDCASAWVSLDERDDDLLAFVGYLLAAILGAFPTLESRTQSLLKAPVTPSVSVVVSYLINDLLQIPEPFILALDDIHLIRQGAIFDLLAALLRHPLPSLHLVLVGRRDPPLPVGSLRAHGQVTEIRARDLRFTPSETARLLARTLGWEIDDEAAAEWTQKAEGWVTALRLAVLSLRHRHTADLPAAAIHEDSQYLQEYLLADVLASLLPVRREWLLKASVLDRFCAPLCERVCRSDPTPGKPELTGQEFVRWLQDENLFLVTLDDKGQWFRFHHLFQGFLRNLLGAQLAPDEVAGLHLRASNWCAENGLIDEAIQYALAAEDVAAAVRLVLRHRYGLMDMEQWRRLDHWLKLLPADAVVQNPLLLSTRAFLALHRGEERELVTAQQQAYLLLAEPASPGMPPPQAAERRAAQGEVAVLQGFEEFYRGQAAAAIARAQKGLEFLSPEAGHIRSMAHCIIADGLQMQGDLEQGVRVFEKALQDPIWPAVLRARMLHGLCIIHFFEGALMGVLEAASECLQIAQESQLPESVSYGRYDLGVAHYLRNEFAQAEPYLLALLEDRSLSTPTYLAFGAFALALIYHSQGRHTEVAQLIELLSTHLQETKQTVAYEITRAFRVELALRQGGLAEARHLSKKVNFDVRPPRWYFYVPQLTRLRLMLAEATPENLAEVRVRLDALDEEMRQINRNHVRIDVLALQALVYRALGKEQTALSKLGTALELGQPGGFIRNFVDLGPPMADLLTRLHRQHEALDSKILTYITGILAAFPAAARAAPSAGPSSRVLGPALDRREGPLPPFPPLAEPLTWRESQILRLLATELSPQEMAGDLFLSTATVRTHIRNIYTKLDVHSRFEAVHRGKELGLF